MCREILKAKAHVLSSQSSHAHSLEKESEDKGSSFAKWSAYAIADSNGSSTSAETMDDDDYTSSCASSSSSVSYESDVEHPVSSIRKRQPRSGLPSWTRQQLIDNAVKFDQISSSLPVSSAPRRRPVLVLLDGYALDVTSYSSHHPGGVAYLRQYAIPLRSTIEPVMLKDASDAFNGGMNNHGTAAKTKMRSLRIARIID